MSAAGLGSSESSPGSPHTHTSDFSFDRSRAATPERTDVAGHHTRHSRTKSFGTSAYARDRRALLKLLAELHGTGIQNLLNLPQIAVVGSQSVGKSSLIESISGIKLPRESGTCTRCPMECRLEYSDSGSWTCRVSLRIQDGDSAEEVPFGDVLTNPDDVERRIRQAQRALLRPSLEPHTFLDDSDLNLRGGHILSFTDNCVCVHIRGPDVTDLHFYDLPGILGQNTSDIDLVRSMVKRYISRPGCIILLVVSCETDFENQVAGRLVRDVDPTGERTVGVLTKPDKTDAESAPKWQRINDVYRLQTGWFVLKLPDSKELREGINADAARERANAFFQANEHWHAYAQNNASRVGTANLTEYLAQRLSEQLRESLPRIREAVQKALIDTISELVSMPPELKNDPTAEVFARITSFAQDVSRHIRGTSQLQIDRQGLVQRLYAAFRRFKTGIRATAPKFDARNESAAAGGVDFTELDSDDGEELRSSDDSAVKVADVMRVATEARTRELPGNYPFSVKAYYIFRFLKMWEGPTFDCFEVAFKGFVEDLAILIDEHFGLYVNGGLLSQVQTVVNSQLQACAADARIVLRMEMLKETESIYTQNEHYLEAYKAKFLGHYKQVRMKQPPPPPRPSSVEASRSGIYDDYEPVIYNDPYQHVRSPQVDPTDAAVRALQAAGYTHVKSTDLPKLLPSHGLDPAFDIMAEVRAYFQVAYKRYIDAVPLCIEQALIRKFEKQLSASLVNDLGLFKPGARTKCAIWVREPPIVAEQRRELLARKETLEEAQSLLVQFG
ncbi:hypothetical protein EXIGLDRAFT_774260 [Exidia glandulosa HHB12029]|uniref:P-loop containing nucleoside triphosphate hydrolase protein n=1 Tax=Exidia glandulosa HHB12029 TaxID=1314781 RepID=A0A165EF09_EXIGL|nr:hypothetical protein EXIGLDRAFT_774260 [Exidia glandulosa HHB12029]